MSAWLSQHLHALALALRRLAAAPLAGLLNVAVIGIAFSLPAGAYMLLQNLQTFSGQVSGAPQLSLFLSLDAGPGAPVQIEARLKQHPQIAGFRFISRDSALQQIKQDTGLADVMDSLERNPLPDAFVVDARESEPAALEQLRAEMRNWPAVEHVQLDSAWAKRLDALLRLGRLAALLLAALLGFALVAVTFNTIRLQILTRRDEIEVSKLIGATDGFIRRPFLYFGALQGMIGAGVAWFIIALAIRLLNDGLTGLTQLYAKDFRLQHLSPEDSAGLLLFAAGLGWLGAWLSVASHLRQIKPR